MKHPLTTGLVRGCYTVFGPDKVPVSSGYSLRLALQDARVHSKITTGVFSICIYRVSEKHHWHHWVCIYQYESGYVLGSPRAIAARMV